MSSLMEKAKSRLELVDLSKQNFRRTLDSLQEGAHSILLLAIQWNEIESYFESTKKVIEERAKELEVLEESMKVQALELKKKEEELCSLDASVKAKLSDLEKREKEFCLEQEAEIEKRKGEVEQMEKFATRCESMEKFSNEKLMELDARAKELEVKVKEVENQKERIIAGEKLNRKFEPLVSLLAKSMGSSVAIHSKCSDLYGYENATDFADDLVKKNAALARMIAHLDPAKLVFDTIEGSYREYLKKEIGEADDRVDSIVKSWIVLLEMLIQLETRITPKVKQEANLLGVKWISKAKTNPNNDSLVLGCLLFLAAYDLASVITREVLVNLLSRFLLYDQAPKLFRLLGLEDKVFGVVETLKKKGEYLATLKFICEFRSYKLCPKGRPGELLFEFLDSSEKAARVIAGTGDSVEAHKARREKRKADAVMALQYINETNAESMFPRKTLKMLIELKDDESAQRAREPVHKRYEKRETTINTMKKSEATSIITNEPKSEAKRQRLTEPVTPFQYSTVNKFGNIPAPSEKKIEKLGVNHQPDAKATYPLRTESKPGSSNADRLRELVEKQPLEESDLSNALKCTPDPAKLVLETSIALSPTNPEGNYEFKLLVTSASCFLLLNQLKKLPPQIGNPVKGDAKKLAVYWKDKISKSKTDELEVICFLQFLGIFGIVSEFKGNDLLHLLNTPYWRTVAPDLCQILGLDNAIPGFIQSLIRTGHRLKAIYYIYSLDVVHRFQPVSAIINDSLRITKESAEKAFIDAKNEFALKVAAIDRQIRHVRAAIKCILSHNLETEFQIENLEEQIKSLMKLRRNSSDKSGFGSGSDLTIKQLQTAKPPNVAEATSITSNTPLEPLATTASASYIPLEPLVATVNASNIPLDPSAATASASNILLEPLTATASASNTLVGTSTAATSSSASKPSLKKKKKKNKRGQKRSLSGINKESSAHVASDTSNHFRGAYDNRGFTGNPNSVYNYQWPYPEGPQHSQYYQHFNRFYNNYY